ncbi:MAG: DNRLRE domain-containing protein, partial [Chloroflexi bacterium]|nr:DNRLRE domain-containing protein [Chloroflexota bacterium]
MRQSNFLKLCAVLIPLLVFLSWSASAQAPGQRSTFPEMNVLPLPGGGGVAALAASTSSSDVLLQADSGISFGFSNRWAAGDRLGVVLRASDLQYPLTIKSVEGYVTWWHFQAQQSNDTVRMRAHIYAVNGGVPTTLLGSSEEVLIDLSGGNPQNWVRKWQAFPLTTPVVLETPKPFLAVVEYVSGTEGSAPSVVIDVSTDIPTGRCFFKSGGGEWLEHYDMPWLNPAEVGYQMIRARVQTSGGPSDITVLSPVGDTYLQQDLPMLTQGEQHYMLVGQFGASGEAKRAMLRFPDPVPPIQGATPVAADLRLFYDCDFEGNHRSNVALQITAHRITESWDEETAGWYTNSTHYAEAYGTCQIPTWEKEPRHYLLTIDVSELVAKWLAGTVPNYGVMLIGGENTPKSAKWFRTSDATLGEKAERPQLIIRWELPPATPPGTPGPTATATLTPTASRTLMPPETD